MKLFIFLLIAVGCLALEPPVSRPRRPPRSDEVDPNRRFSVITPATIRRDRPFRVYLHGYDIEESFYVTVSIRSLTEKKIVLTKSVQLSPSNYKPNFKFDTSILPLTRQELELTIQADNYRETRTLEHIVKDSALFVQLNKPIYQPSQAVQFRVFSIDSDGNSITPANPISIAVVDPRRNEIAKYTNVTFKRGVFASEFLLSSKPILGTWTLNIQGNERNMMKAFQVDEYVLPLFTAKLTVPSLVSVNDTKFPVTIEAEYTFGEAVNGVATVRFSSSNSPGGTTKTITINSQTTTFDVDIARDLHAINPNSRYFVATLTFNDPLTNTEVIDAKDIILVGYKYSLITDGPNRLVPNKPFTFTYFLKKVDGTPAPSGVKIQYTFTVYFSNQPSVVRPVKVLTTGRDGTVTETLDFGDIDQTTVHSITVRPDVAESSGGGFLRASVYRPSNQLQGFTLELMSGGEQPSFKDELNFKATFTEDVDVIIYFAVAKGVILESSRVFVEEGEREATITIQSNYKYFPQMSLYTYYFVSANNMVKSSYLNVMFKQEMPNYLTLSLSDADDAGNKQVKPGADISLSVDSKPNSYVYLLAIDKRVLLKAQGHNFTEDNVLEFLNDVPETSDRLNSDYRWIARNAGLHFFTNLNRHPLPSLPRKPRPERREMRGSKPRSSGQRRGDPKTRKDFRETFLWESVFISDGPEEVEAKVPESITTYVIQGVSMNKYDGIGLSKAECSATTFLDFFISMELPFSIKKGETLVQTVAIFNYLRGTQNVKITINRDRMFDVVDAAGYGWEVTSTTLTKTVRAEPRKSIQVEFAIKPKSVGFINLVVTAKGTLAGDKVEKALRVVPQGVPRSITTSALFAIDANNPGKKTTLKCKLPPSAYEDTTEASATVIGDILGKALNNLDQLIRMPNGCGEQTLLGFVPDVAVLKYLIATNQLTDALKAKLLQYLTHGYQNELSFQRNDGSFSAFGNSDASGSSWLSAYAIYSFYLAKDFIAISPNVMTRALNFIIKQQDPSTGAFREPGRVIHKDMQGAAGNGVALTAYITIVLATLAPDYPTAVASRDLAIKYLESQVGSITDVYALGVISYALTLAGSSKASSTFATFKAKAVVDDVTLLYWKATAPVDPNYYYQVIPRSIDVEISAYGLATSVASKSPLTYSIRIVKYLISKSNSYGGYSSSQDTVMALLALSSFAQSAKLGKPNVSLKLTSGPSGTRYDVVVSSKNALTVQTTVLDSDTRELTIEPSKSSTGVAIVSLICNFYEDPTKIKPDFKITTTYDRPCRYGFAVKICVRHIPQGKSNMAIMEIRMPSGFIHQTPWWARNGNEAISKIETFEAETVAVYYFNSIPNEDLCTTVNAYKRSNILDFKPGSIKINDYYDTSKEGSATLAPEIDLSNPCYRYLRE